MSDEQAPSLWYPARGDEAPWLWLCVFPEMQPLAQVRAFWKGELDEISGRAADEDQFFLGVSDPAKDRPSASAADRVAALLFRHGTTPEYTLPKLTHPLIKSIRAAFAPISTDCWPAAGQESLRRFLGNHRGHFALVRDGGGPNTGNHDAELDRLMREHAASQPHGSHTVRVTLRRLGDDEPDDGGGSGVREPRRPLPNRPPTSAALELDED